ncbi:ankyrin [Fomitiporia mediterranea MF3/22]|uniref:ankyrin n=1 Tax=Fomitiporia mediterranea (strain MF3/22) TaxID=694068 RepID=UPI0004407F5D|nr:ankyrin [Fomitiporia mediterranea MF3/22]EJD01422.1 ankyrin [Fomitiporia mediterranea MF3/22]
MAEKDPSARLRRAVKENNLFLVKRLIQRTDMRNPDPNTRRYTSLAWAAVLGHEETFEFLLYAGHDDEELSKVRTSPLLFRGLLSSFDTGCLSTRQDADNNTILILLSELRPGAHNPYYPTCSHPDLMGAALRMARIYYERYPFILEWSNVQGKTALHAAALKGNEELAAMLCDLGADFDLPDNLGNTPLHYASAWGHVAVVVLLIERGCQFAARNHDGFTASDYAYSRNTLSTLEEAARMQFENKKNARRRARNQDLKGAKNGANRMRSVSGGSRTTATSDSGDVGLSPMQPLLGSSFSSSSSQPIMSTPVSKLSTPYPAPVLNHSHSFTSSPVPSTQYSLASSLTLPTADISHVLSPIASRVRERDADAIAEYKKRNRSGSAATQASDSKSTTNGVSTLPTINGSNSHLPLATPTASNSPSVPVPVADRRLRPSFSAAQLRSTPPPPPVPVVVGSMDLQTPRNRAGTTPTTSRPGQASPLEANFPAIGTPVANGQQLERRHSARRAGTVPTRLQEDPGDFTGPSSDYAIFPDPPPPKPSSRRTAFAKLGKPLPSIDAQKIQRDHRRTASEIRS